MVKMLDTMEKAMAQLTMQNESQLTGEELLLMGDVGPCELIDGRVMPISLTGGEHGRIENRRGFELTLFVRQKQSGWCWWVK
jgi:Uma2 family endonuclease